MAETKYTAARRKKKLATDLARTKHAITPTQAEIDAERTAAGGWTRKTLAKWGVPWPPPRGWRKALIARADEEEERRHG